MPIGFQEITDTSTSLDSDTSLTGTFSSSIPNKDSIYSILVYPNAIQKYSSSYIREHELPLFTLNIYKLDWDNGYNAFYIRGASTDLFYLNIGSYNYNSITFSSNKIVIKAPSYTYFPSYTGYRWRITLLYV